MTTPKINEVFDNPGVTVPEMSVEEAMDYIFSVGLTVAGLPGSMAFARHQTLKGHLIYVDTEHLGDQGAKDIITVLKAVTGHTSSRVDTPGLPEAAARLKMARRVAQSTLSSLGLPADDHLQRQAQGHRQPGPPSHLGGGEAGEVGEVSWGGGGAGGGVHTGMAAGIGLVVAGS